MNAQISPAPPSAPPASTPAAAPPTPQELQAALDKAVIGLFQQKASSFLMTIYCAHEVLWDPACPTAKTTGKKLHFNPTWFMGLTERSRISLIAHEMWHVAYMHTDPAVWQFRDPRTLNQAMDHVINLMLLDHGYHFDMDGCYDARFKDMTTDQVYNVLMNEKGAQPPQCSGTGAGQGGGPGGASAPPDGAPGPDLPWGQDVEAGTAADAADVVSTVIRAVTMARMNKQAGDLPGELLTKIDELLNPKLPWDVLLRRWLNQVSREGYSWQRPNRRYQHHGMYLPAKMGDEGLDHLMWAMDSSGSMSDEQLKVLNSEVADVKARYNPTMMTLCCFDTKVRKVWSVDDNTEFSGLDFHGRGGTSMTDVWRLAEEKRPTALVVLSDMECNIPASPPAGNIPVLWVCFDNPGWQPPFGSVIHLDTAA